MSIRNAVQSKNRVSDIWQLLGFYIHEMLLKPSSFHVLLTSFLIYVAEVQSDSDVLVLVVLLKCFE